tara:strand:+ start:559 stop:810 length:252 start_codon:yes stop_codon:yes gene_type:complete
MSDGKVVDLLGVKLQKSVEEIDPIKQIMISWYPLSENHVGFRAAFGGIDADDPHELRELLLHVEYAFKEFIDKAEAAQRDKKK